MGITISNGKMSATFHPENGGWESVTFKGEEILQKKGKSFDICIENKPLFLFGPPELSEYKISNDGRGVDLIYLNNGLKITFNAELASEEAVLNQKITLECLDMTAPRMLTEIRFETPALRAGAPEDCLLQTPGQHIPINTPYTTAAKKPLDRRFPEPLPPYFQGWLEGTPDQAPGLIAIENKRTKTIVSTWFYSEIGPGFPTVDGDGENLNIDVRHQISAWLKPGISVTSEKNVLMATEGSLEDHYALYREQAYGNHLITKPVPEWFKNTRLLQIAPYPLKPFHDRLEEYADIGFNLIYLCPVQTGTWYRIQDHYSIGDHVATENELKAFVADCHKLGMKVIFDFIPQGICVKNPNLKDFEKWMVRDGFGRPFGSHGWGNPPGAPLNDTLSLDWGDPEYQKFAVDWAMWYIDTFNIDGFRCDAMHWKEPNFNPELDRPARTTAFGGFQIMDQLYKRLKAQNPEAILLSEVWGPLFQRCTDASYENGWLLSKINKAWMSGKPFFSGRDWQNFQTHSALARPEAYLRTNFTANHDLIEIAEIAKTNPMCNALNFMHTFTGDIPFIMWLEPDNRGEFFKSLFSEHKKLSGYECSYDKAVADADSCYLALWEKEGNPAKLAVTNTDKESAVDTFIGLPESFSRATISLSVDDAQVAQSENGIRVKLPASGYALITVS